MLNDKIYLGGERTGNYTNPCSMKTILALYEVWKDQNATDSWDGLESFEDYIVNNFTELDDSRIILSQIKCYLGKYPDNESFCKAHELPSTREKGEEGYEEDSENIYYGGTDEELATAGYFVVWCPIENINHYFTD